MRSRRIGLKNRLFERFHQNVNQHYASGTVTIDHCVAKRYSDMFPLRFLPLFRFSNLQVLFQAILEVFLCFGKIRLQSSSKVIPIGNAIGWRNNIEMADLRSKVTEVLLFIEWLLRLFMW